MINLYKIRYCNDITIIAILEAQRKSYVFDSSLCYIQDRKKLLKFWVLLFKILLI